MIKKILVTVILFTVIYFLYGQDKFDCDPKKDKNCEEINIPEKNACSQLYEKCLLKCKTEACEQKCDIEYEKCMDNLE